MDQLYMKLEHFLTKNETNAEVKVKKQMMIYHFTLLFIYFTILPFVSPYTTPKSTIFHYVLCTCNLLVLRMKNYNFVISFFVISYTLGLYVSSTRVENTLRIIGQALVQHNHSFMIYNNKIFKTVCIIISLIIVNSAQNHLQGLIQDNNIPAILDIVHRLQYSWGPLYIFNQFCAMHFAKNYARVLKQTEEINKDLEKTNEELCEMNDRMKNTMSLLEEKNKELNAALQTRELFIAGVSHEFRNPLNSMMGNIELLALEIKDPKWKEMLNTCKICGDVLLGLINNILDVAKINAEKLELSFQPVDFHRLVEKVWSVSSIKIREKGLTGHLSISGDLPQYLEMDSHRLTQILLNIIGNATKFTSKGFVKINMSWHTNKGVEELRGVNKEFLHRTSQASKNDAIFQDLDIEENPTLNSSSLFSEAAIMEYSDASFHELKQQLPKRLFSARTLSDLNGYSNEIILTQNDKCFEKRAPSALPCQKEEGILKIEIFDTGCGISPCALEKLFRPFTQADSSITRRFGGTGLGLYISKQLIQKMNGEIFVSSEENGGTNFCILIPTRSLGAEEIEELRQEDDIVQKEEDDETIRALVVDDILLNQILMTQYLKKMNIQADIASNGEEAVQKFKEKGFGYYSFISMDIQMPVMDGMTASKKIREYEAKNNVGSERRVPIMMVTGNCTEMEKDYCLNPEGEIKASYFFRKPFVFEECRSCVKNILLFNRELKSQQEQEQQ